MDDGNNGPGRVQHLHHHGGGMEGAAGGGGGGGGAVGGSSNGLTLSLPLPSASSSAKPSAPPGPSPQAAVTSEAAAAGAFGERAVGGRDDIWSQGATITLIEAWGNRYLELNRGNLKQKHWKEVADAVNSCPANNKPAKTDVQCKNRLDTLKKKYKVEKNRMLGGTPTKWTLFAKMDELIGPSRKQQHKPQHPSPQLALPLPPPPPQQPPPPPPPQMPALPAVRHSRPPMDSSPDLLNNFNNHQSPDMTESCLNGFNNNPINGNIAKKRRAMAQHGDYSPLKELASAIMKFSEVYERIEDAKQQQMMYLEKQRMEFAKDLELQRMHLFMQNQLELAKIKHGKNGDSTEHYL